MWTETERHENCTVVVLENSETGEVSIGWYKNDNPPALIVTDLEEHTS